MRPRDWLVLGRHLENSGEVAHIEEVVELGRGREHLGLHRAPQADGHLGQVPNHLCKRDNASMPRGGYLFCSEPTDKRRAIRENARLAVGAPRRLRRVLISMEAAKD